MSGRAWQRECERFGHGVSAVRKDGGQGMLEFCLLALFSFFLGLQSMEWCCL